MKKILFLLMTLNFLVVGSSVAEESAMGDSGSCEDKVDTPVAPVAVTVKPPESKTTTVEQKINPQGVQETVAPDASGSVAK